MPLHTSIFHVSFTVLLLGCSADATGNTSRGMPAPAAGSTATAAGTSGTFGNATPTAPGTGNAGAVAAMPMPRSGCTGGEYRGRYTCDLEVIGIPSSLDGDVSFALAINEKVVPDRCR